MVTWPPGLIYLTDADLFTIADNERSERYFFGGDFRTAFLACFAFLAD